MSVLGMMKVDRVEEEKILGSADRTGGSTVFKWEREQASHVSGSRDSHLRIWSLLNLDPIMTARVCSLLGLQRPLVP